MLKYHEIIYIETILIDWIQEPLAPALKFRVANAILLC